MRTNGDWQSDLERFRYESAAAITVGTLAGKFMMETAERVKYAVVVADALIAELAKAKGTAR